MKENINSCKQLRGFATQSATQIHAYVDRKWTVIDHRIHHQVYAAGLAEGHVTSLIQLYWLNTVEGYCKPRNLSTYYRKLKKHLDINIKWMVQTLQKADAADPYCHQVHRHTGCPKG
jgi:TPP-dependent pyruvate/acetoin dehydrogenase alpha subunit